MNLGEQGAVFASLFVMGLAGSLHCVAMCGPILLGFSRMLDSRSGSQLDFIAYHAGRVWTYAFLGLTIGWLGTGLRHTTAAFGLQRQLSVLTSLLILGSGLAALGLFPGWKLKLSAPSSCVATKKPPWLVAMLAEPRKVARLLLGAIMGLLPCGLVYAALLVAAALPTPFHSAFGMLGFGLGTVPALSAVVFGSRRVPHRIPFGGSTVTAIVLVAVGLVMLTRSLMVSLGQHG